MSRLLSIAVLFLLVAVGRGTAYPLFRSEADIDRALAEEDLDYESYQVLKDLFLHPIVPCEAPLDLFLIPGVTGEEVDLIERLCAEERLSTASLPAPLIEKIGLFTDWGGERPSFGVRAKYGYSRNLGDSADPYPMDHAFRVEYGKGPVRFVTQGKSDALGTGVFQRNSLMVSHGPAKFTLGSFRKSEGLGLALGGSIRTPARVAPDTGFRNTFMAPMSGDLFGGDLAFCLRQFRLGVFGSSRESGLFENANNLLAGGKVEMRAGPSTTGFIAVHSGIGGVAGQTAQTGQCFSFYEQYRTRDLTFKTELAFSGEGTGLAGEGTLGTGDFRYGFGFWRYSKGFFSPAGRGPRLRLRSSAEVFPEADSITLYELRRGEEGASLRGVYGTKRFELKPSVILGRTLEGATVSCDLRLEEESAIPFIASRFGSDLRFLWSEKEGGGRRNWYSTFKVETRISPLLEWRNEVRMNGRDDTLRNGTVQSGVAFFPFVFLEGRLAAWAGFPRKSDDAHRQAGLEIVEGLRFQNREWLRAHLRLSRDPEAGKLRLSSLGLTCELSY